MYICTYVYRVEGSRELVAVEPEGVQLLEGRDRLGDDRQEVLVEQEDLEVHEQPDFVGKHLRTSLLSIGEKLFDDWEIEIAFRKLGDGG